MKNNGLFITFEGPDGSGKSTIINMVYECIHKKYKNIYLTREPGGKNNVIAEDIRNILLNKLDYQIDSRAEALLFAASRAQHVKDFIKPHLLNNDIVLCDRYVHSSLVYQGCARGLGIKEVWDINLFGIDNILPNLTIILMIKPEDGIKRILSNSLTREVNRLDKEKMSMHQLVYEGYRKLIDENRNKTIVEIDASKPVQEVFNDTIKVVQTLVDKHYAQ